MRWFVVDDPGCATLPEDMRDIGMSQEADELYVAAGLGGDESDVLQSASRDRIAFVRHRQQAYVPARWLAERYPVARDNCAILADAASRVRHGDAECVWRLGELVSRIGPLDDFAIARALEQAGFARARCVDAMRFAPLAVGRRGLSGRDVRFSPHFFELAPDGAMIRHGLVADNGLYAAAFELAPQFTAEAIRQLVLRSAEVRSYMEATSHGEVAEPLSLAPAVFFVGLPTRAGIRQSRELIDAYRRRSQGGIVDTL